MRLISYEGVDHKVSERNWKQLIKRFDADKASRNAFGYYFIPITSICVNRDYKCIRCPLRDPHKKINSCTYLFSHIIGEDLLKHVHLRDSGILWEPQYDADARQALQKVSEVLTKAVKLVSGKKPAKAS